MKIAACAVLISLMVLGVAVAQKPAAGDDAALKALELKWETATLKADAAGLGTILADQFISTSTEGKVRTKAEMLGQLKSGEVKYLSSKIDDMKTYIYGDAAVVTGQWKGKVVEKGKTVDSTERFTDTFVRQSGQWRCVASHASPMK